MSQDLPQADMFEQRLMRALYRVQALGAEQLSATQRPPTTEKILLEARFDETDETQLNLSQKHWMLNDRMRDVVSYAIDQRLSELRNGLG